MLTRESGKAKLLSLPSCLVWQFQRRSHFPDEPLTHDFAGFWIHVVRNGPVRSSSPYMYVRGNGSDLARTRDRIWEDRMDHWMRVTGEHPYSVSSRSTL